MSYYYTENNDIIYTKLQNTYNVSFNEEEWTVQICKHRVQCLYCEPVKEQTFICNFRALKLYQIPGRTISLYKLYPHM